jgi:hypothetical protein
MRKLLSLFFLFSTTVAMAQKNLKRDDFLKSLLMSNPLLKPLLENNNLYKIQIVYTQIDRNKNNEPTFKQFNFNVDHSLYFYPASTAKMPVAFLSLQKLNELNIAGLDKNTSMITDSGYEKNSILNEPTSADGRPTIAHYIKEIFMVSDNEANNRLYEFLGQEYINNELEKKSFKEAQILHRLGVSLSEEENRKTNAILFVDKNGKSIYTQPSRFSKLNYIKRKDYLGKGFYKNDILKNEPFDFSTKNRLYLDDMTQMLLSVYFPEKFSAKQRFNLKDDDYKFIYKYMSQKPTESTFPNYDSTEYKDDYCKFLMYGSEGTKIPANIRIFNKVGNAYGFLTDVAYIADFENNIEFALSATIYVNKDDIFNDDKYEYTTVGFPFMKNIGKTIYEYELNRERKNKPDLSKFKMIYDK